MEPVECKRERADDCLPVTRVDTVRWREGRRRECELLKSD